MAWRGDHHILKTTKNEIERVAYAYAIPSTSWPLWFTDDPGQPPSFMLSTVDAENGGLLWCKTNLNFPILCSSRLVAAPHCQYQGVAGRHTSGHPSKPGGAEAQTGTRVNYQAPVPSWSANNELWHTPDYQGGQGIGGRGWYSASASVSGWQADAKSFEESRYRKLLGGCGDSMLAAVRHWVCCSVSESYLLRVNFIVINQSALCLVLRPNKPWSTACWGRKK